MRQGRYDQAFPSIWLVVFVVVLGTKALAFSIQEDGNSWPGRSRGIRPPCRP